jgi:DNA-binding HxlR family transcriptional regulator
MIIDDKEMIVRINGRDFHCALDVTMGYIGGKWKTVVLWYLRKEKKRFSELKARIPDITEKMLSLQLKELERDGIVKRKVYAEVPPRVEYSLTDFGKSLVPVLESIADWGRKLGKESGTFLEKEKKKKKKKKD